MKKGVWFYTFTSHSRISAILFNLEIDFANAFICNQSSGSVELKTKERSCLTLVAMTTQHVSPKKNNIWIFIKKITEHISYKNKCIIHTFIRFICIRHGAFTTISSESITTITNMYLIYIIGYFN